MDDNTVEVTVELDDALAGALVSSVGRNRLHELPGDYETVGADEGVKSDEAAFTGGALIYTVGAADALLVAAYERARGYRTVLLRTTGRPRQFVVLTSRPRAYFGL